MSLVVCLRCGFFWIQIFPFYWGVPNVSSPWSTNPRVLVELRISLVFKTCDVVFIC